MRLLVPLVALAALAAGEGFRVGRGTVKITPPAGVPLAGYYHVRLAEGVHDDLWAKALVFEAGPRKAALVMMDLESIDAALVAEARKLIEAATGIPVGAVMIAATHTHTGPLLDKVYFPYLDAAPRRAAAAYRAGLPARIAEAVKLADAALAPARAHQGTGREDSVSFYRRFLMKDGTVRFNPGKMNPGIVQPMGEIDPELAFLHFDSPEGRPLANIVNFALHLDTAGGAQISADYPYTLSRLLGKVQGAGTLTLFGNGAAGNINHIDVRNKDPQKGHAEAERIGTILAGEVLKTLVRVKPVGMAELRLAQETIPLAAPKIAAERLKWAKSTAARFGKPSPPPFLELVEAFKIVDLESRGALEAEVQLIALGDHVAIVGIPGELFTELGVAIKKASPFPQTLVVELANGSLSYIPTRKAFAEGGYEVINALGAPGCGEALAEAAIRMLAALYRTPQ